VNTPVKSPPRERPLLLMFLAEHENGAWKSAAPDWVEERIDGAVEVVPQRAPRAEGSHCWAAQNILAMNRLA
jgi:hypothetical protein